MEGTTINDASVRNRVALGAQHCDEHDPTWFKRINVERLDIANAGNCIAGQLYGSYNANMWQLGIPPGSDRAVAFGFRSEREVTEDGLLEEYVALTKAWKAEIEDRLRQQAAAA